MLEPVPTVLFPSIYGTTFFIQISISGWSWSVNDSNTTAPCSAGLEKRSVRLRVLTDLGRDGDGLIRARVVGAEPPLYRIYDQEGKLVCYVEFTDAPVGGQFLDIRISPWGIAVFPYDPAVEFIQVYLFEPPDIRDSLGTG